MSNTPDTDPAAPQAERSLLDFDVDLDIIVQIALDRLALSIQALRLALEAARQVPGVCSGLTTYAAGRPTHLIWPTGAKLPFSCSRRPPRPSCAITPRPPRP